MGVSEYLVKQALNKSSAKYVDSAKEDIMGALRDFKDLSPDNESFLFPDGKRRTAFCLRGTIPVHYKGNTYNIPIAIYLWETHPYYAPICYVRPTANMVIRESETVNKEGKVFMPYISEWRFPGHDLNGLLQIMAIMFAEKCPVFAAPSGSSAAPKRSSQVNPPVPGPSATTAAARTPYPTATPAMPTPYPATGTPYPTPYPNTNSTPFPSPYMNTPAPYGAGIQPPPPPPRQAPPVPPPPAGTIRAEDIRASIMSALEDKIRLRLRENIGTKYAEMASIAQTKRDLLNGQQRVKQIVEELEKSQTELSAFITTYEEKKRELARALADDGGDGKDIDSVIDATTPLHRQLLLNYANDLACDDVIYALGQALIRGKMSASDYVKHARAVARRQFVYRATMQKCRIAAGLRT